MADLPMGTVTFLFTDLEGSTRLWEEHAEAMKGALARHDEMLRGAIEGHGGIVISEMGDGMAAVFASAPAAVAATLEMQLHLGREQWGPTGPLRARMGLLTDQGVLRAPGQYSNRPLNRCARLMAVAHGGQVVLAESVASLIREELPTDASLIDLGVHSLRDVPEPIHVFQLAHPDLPRKFPVLRSLDATRGNLPRQMTSFVGRERDVDEIVALLADHALVTLTGVGGVGKTRLALEVASEIAPDFEDGAWLCELAPVGDPDALWDVLAATLDVSLAPGRPIDERVREYLATKRLLLVLDNCEHLLDPIGRVVDALTQGCPDIVVLATSREGLALPGEQLVAVPSLAVPADDDTIDALGQSDAVRLFVERAQDANRDFALSDDNAQAVVQLCRRLDGIPLAIELAAARVRSFTPRELVGRLDQRFRLLTRGSRVGLERHQTLRSTIDWSYELLTMTERAALNRLSVFAGGCDLAAAEAVLPDDDLDADDVADVLSQLVDKSLVVVDADQQTGTRYMLLETIRQYAAEQLEISGETGALRARHADHFVHVAEDAGPRLRRRGQLTVAAAMVGEIDNFRAVLDWALEAGSAEHAQRLVAPLAASGMTLGYAAMGWADAARLIPGAAEHAMFPAVTAWAAWGKVMQGDFGSARELVATAATAQERLGTQHLWVYMALAVLPFFTGDLDAARAGAEEWVALARPTGDPYEIASALVLLGATLQVSNVDAARAILEEAVQIAREADVPSVLAIGLSQLAFMLMSQDPERAMVILDETREVGLLVGDHQAVSQVPLVKSWIAVQRHDWEAALRAAQDAANQKLALADLAILPSTFGTASIALARLHALEPSAVLFGARDRAPFWAGDWQTELDRIEASLMEGLGDDRLAALRARGAAMSPTDAVGYLNAEAARILDS